MKILKFMFCTVFFLLCLCHNAFANSVTETAKIIDFTNCENGIVNRRDSAEISHTEIDGRSAVKIVPNPQCDAASYISVDGYSFSQYSIDLEKYCYVAYEYYYKSDSPLSVFMNADILPQKGAITTRISVNSNEKIVSGKWSVALFDFSSVKQYLNEETDNHNLYQMHFRPFGLKKLSELSANDEIYVSKIMFFTEKPQLTYVNSFINGYDDGTFGAAKKLTRAEACAMTARRIAETETIIGTSPYADVSQENWYYGYIGYLWEKGVLNFCTEEYFKPDEYITGADFARLLINSGIVADMGTALENGYLGSADLFAESSSVSRIKAAMIINQLGGRVVYKECIPESIEVLFLDVNRENSYFAEIAEACFDHVSVGEKWLYASQDPIYELISKVGEDVFYDVESGNAKVKELDGLEKTRIAEIAATENIPVTGKAVYVSASFGNDVYNGLSDEYPVKTIARANAIASAGWQIRLLRGDVWREKFTAKAGVTYTAYGDGDKPKIYGSPENGASASKWKLVYENEETGALIWKYAREDLTDVGTIVFNNGEGYAVKEIPSCNGAEFVMRNNHEVLFDYTAELDNNLEFFHAANSSLKQTPASGDFIDIANSVGPLYLRCDNGNPGKVFDSIEFNTRGNIISVGGDNVTVDNLCIMYGGSHGIGSGSVKNLTVTNCEIGWIGGSIQGYNANGSTNNDATRFGNGVEIYGSCDGYIIDNCRVYQCYDAGVTHQFSTLSNGNCTMLNVTYSNNLITDCVYSIEYFLGYTGNYERYGNNILFDSNILRRAGFGFGSSRPDGYNQRHIRSSDRENPFTNYVIKNNVFDRSVFQLISAITTKEEFIPQMSGNTYIQGVGNGFYSFAMYGSAKTDYTSQKSVKNVLNDETGKLYFVKNIPYYKYDYQPSRTVAVTSSDRQ